MHKFLESRPFPDRVQPHIPRYKQPGIFAGDEDDEENHYINKDRMDGERIFKVIYI